MNVVVRGAKRLGLCFSLFPLLLVSQAAHAALTNQTVRIMAANLTSTSQTYETPGLNILKGLKPDIVAIQEFKYGSSTPAEIRSMVDTTFGPSFAYYREPTGSIPNGIISRFPIVAAGSWDDPLVSDRGFAWAQLDLPGSNDLYVVSVHLYSSGSAGDRNTEATVIKSNVQASFPANAWVVVAGDFNTASRSEAAVTTFKTFLSDNAIPTDAEIGGNPNTNAGRDNPYDYVLPSFSFVTNLIPAVFPSNTFTNGLVFDSQVYTPLLDVFPVAYSDSHSSGMQHMAVVKDFRIVYGTTNAPSDAPTILVQPQSQTVEPGSNATFTVTASGATTLYYQWRFGGGELSGATTSALAITNAQPVNAGSYTVVVTNAVGSVTSSPATLSVGSAPVITSQPESQSVTVGMTVNFSVTSTGTSPLAYQWRFNGANLTGATASSLTLANVQTADAGSYSVVITNIAGSTGSADAVLAVSSSPDSIIVQWDFNSPTPDGITTTGTLVPSAGSGTASYIGGAAAAGSGEFATGSSTDPNTSDNSGWNTSNYPDATVGNKTAGVKFAVSTVGRQNISIRWDQRESNTGSKYVRLRYTTNGVDFIDFPTAVSVSGTSFEPKTNSLVAFAGVNNNPNFAFQIVAEFESTATGAGGANYVAANSGSTYGTAGTVRFDMVTVSGSAIPSVTAPGITAQPITQAVNQGANATFTVQATGTAPLSYQWRHNSLAIPGATGSVYTRANVQPADMGSYSVVVTNSAGTATSSNAMLSLQVPAPSLLMVSPQVIQWQGLSNLTYTVQGRTNIGDNWSALGTAAAPGLTVRFTNQIAAPQRFYRVVYP